MPYLFDSSARIWKREGYGGIGYSDGDETETRLETIVEKVDDRSSLSGAFIPYLSDWASEYHFSRQRHCLIRPLGISSGDKVLELGCGCGAITRYLGEIGAEVTAVEGSPRRAAIARKRCEELENVKIYCDNLLAFESDETFDWVLLIGVLEYAPVFSDSSSSVSDYLKKAARFLDRQGRLIVAIENQLGLKYFNGRPEDHVGQPFYGINGLYTRHDPVTFGREALQGILAEAGLKTQTIYFPFPDYKLPSVVLSESGLENPGFNATDLLAGAESRDYLGGVPPLFSEPLAYRPLYKNGLLADLANSFLIEASFGGGEPDRKELSPLAWYFTIGQRRREYCTQTIFASEEGRVTATKSALGDDQGRPRARRLALGALTQDLNVGDYVLGSLSVLGFMQTKLRARSEKELADWFGPWFAFVMESAFVSSGGDPGRLEAWRVSGDMLDATPSNAVVTEGGLRLIDQEWVVDGDIPLGWLLYRAIRWTLPSGLSDHLESIDGLAVFEQICRNAGLRFDSSSLSDYADFERELMRLINIRGGEIDVGIDKVSSSYTALSPIAEMVRERNAEKRFGVMRDELDRLRSELERERAARTLDQARYQSLVEQHELICRLHARERHTVVRPVLRMGYRVGRPLFRKLPLSTKMRVKSLAKRILPGAVRRGEVISSPPLAENDPNNGLSGIWREPVLSAKGNSWDVVVFPVIDWDFRFQRPQHLAAGLAGEGRRIFYLATTFFESDRPSFRIEASPRDNLFLVRLGLPAPHPNIYTSSPTDAQVSNIRMALLEMYRACELDAAAALINLPFWHRPTTGLPSTIQVYDCMDHHAGFSTNAGDVQLEEERKLLAAAELVVASSARLQQNLRPISESILIRNAGDIEFFSQRPDKLALERQRPVVGYYGAISDWFDVDLVCRAARKFPQWDFVLVGEVTHKAIQPLKKLSNVMFVGEVPYTELPKYLHSFDVCMIPFIINELTRCTNPVKIYEYMAAGKPVVTTDMPELRLLDDICHVAEDGERFLALLEQAMNESGDAELAARRQQWAGQHDWQGRVKELCDAIDACWPKISVIILTYNNLEFTQACLKSVGNHTRYPNAEIIIVDNASTDGTPDYLRAYQKAHPEIKVILNDDNKGFAAGNNIGLRAATGDYLVVLNNDTYVTDGWLYGLVRHIRRYPDIGLIGPVTNNIGNEAKIELAYHSMAEMQRKARSYTECHVNDLLEVENVAFFCVALSREVYETVGGLDEDFGLGFFEDDDYCRRVAAAGYRITIANDVFVHHHLSASFNKLDDKKRQALFDENKAIYEKKWGQWKPHEYR